MKKMDKSDASLLGQPVDNDKKNAKKTIIEIIGIIFILLLIVGTFLVVKNRDKILSSLPISTDSDGKIVLGKKKDNSSSSNRGKTLEKPDTLSFAQMYDNLEMKVDNFEVLDDGFEFTLNVSKDFGRIREKVYYHLYCEKMAVDGYEISNTFDLEFDSDNPSNSVEIKIDKSELDVYEITKPNSITFFLLNENDKTRGVKPLRVNLSTIYYAPMDNSLRGLINVGTEAGLNISFYKQVEDIDSTYLYFNADNNSANDISIKIKKLAINDSIYEIDDFNVDVYYYIDKLFYIKIPRKDIPSVKKAVISFFIINGKDTETQEIYVTNEYTHYE